MIQRDGVLVVGGGIMGLTAAWALARAGVAVRLLEAGPLPRPEASSYAPQRIIRHPYGPLHGYAAMIDEAYRGWERLWDDLGVWHYAHTGTLVLTSYATEWLEDSAHGMRRAGVPFERLAPAAVIERFPMIRADGLKAALHAPSGGVLFADRILRDLVAHLRRQGTELHEHQPVAAVDRDGRGVTLADGRHLAADILVVAAGPWTERLWPEAAHRFVPTRQVEAHIPTLAGRSLAGLPVLIDIHPDVGFYMTPPTGGLLAKTGDHRFGRRGNPDDDRGADPAIATSLAARAAARVLHLDVDAAVPGRACYYCLADDERFLVEPLDAKGRSWRLAGFSGHGFKFAAALGLRLADTITRSLDPAALSAWAAGRSDGGR